MTPLQRKLYYTLAKKMLTNTRPLSIWNFTKYKLGLKSSPISVQLYVNKTCNLSCDFCFFKSALNLKDAKEYNLTIPKLKRILESPLVKNSLRIGLTGGEPFLNSEIYELIAMIKKKKHLLSISTNGTLIAEDKEITKLKKAKVDVLSLSLYKENRDCLRYIIPKLKDTSFIKIQKIIFTDRLDEIDTTIQFGIDTKAHSILFNTYYTKNTGKNTTDSFILSIPREKAKEKYGNKIAIQWGQAYRQDWELRSFPEERKCRLPFYHIETDANGNIAPCCYVYPSGTKYGSIFTAESWSSKFYEYLRECLSNKLRPLKGTKFFAEPYPLPNICKNCPYLYENLYGL